MFPNGGYTVWEVDHKKLGPKKLDKPPKTISKYSTPVVTSPTVPQTNKLPHPLPVPVRHEIIVKVEGVHASCACDKCEVGGLIPPVPSPSVMTFWF